MAQLVSAVRRRFCGVVRRSVFPWKENLLLFPHSNQGAGGGGGGGDFPAIDQRPVLGVVRNGIA